MLEFLGSRVYKLVQDFLFPQEFCHTVAVYWKFHGHDFKFL